MISFDDIVHHAHRTALVKGAVGAASDEHVTEPSADAPEADAAPRAMSTIVVPAPTLTPEAEARWMARMKKAAQRVLSETPMATAARVANELAPGGQYHGLVVDADEGAAVVQPLDAETTFTLALDLNFAGMALARLAQGVMGAAKDKMAEEEHQS